MPNQRNRQRGCPQCGGRNGLEIKSLAKCGHFACPPCFKAASHGDCRVCRKNEMCAAVLNNKVYEEPFPEPDEAQRKLSLRPKTELETNQERIEAMIRSNWPRQRVQTDREIDRAAEIANRRTEAKLKEIHTDEAYLKRKEKEKEVREKNKKEWLAMEAAKRML